MASPPLVQSDPFAAPEVDGQPPLDDDVYEVEKILRAYKSKRRWYYTVKWVGWARTTEEPRSVLYPDATADVRDEMKQAEARYLLADAPLVVNEEDDSDTDDTKDQSPADEDGVYGLQDDGPFIPLLSLDSNCISYLMSSLKVISLVT